MQWDIAIAGCFVGFVIGLTGMGGGALMTPILRGPDVYLVEDHRLFAWRLGAR